MALAFGTLPQLTHLGNRQLVSRVAPKFLSPKIIGPICFKLGSVEKRNSMVVAKAVGDKSESSSGSIGKALQSTLSSSEDLLGLAGLGFAGIVAIWAASNLVSAVEKLPLFPSLFEFIGILYSSWFVYRYLLFKPDREELLTIIKNSISIITGK